MKEESRSKAKQKQVQKGKDVFHEEFEEVTTGYRKVIREEPKKIKIEVKREKESKKTETQVYKKSPLPRPFTIRSELKLVSRKLELRITSPSEITLTDKQRILLYILYNMFKGRNIKDIVTIVSKALGIDIEDLLHELLTLENLNLIVVDNGIVKFTSKGEIVVGTVTIDRSIINKVRELIAKVPKPAFIHISNNIVVKALDKEEYVARMRTPERIPVVPTIPRIHISNPIPLRMDRSLNITLTSKYRIKQVVIPRISQVTPPEIRIKTLDKTVTVTLIKRYEAVKKPAIKAVRKIRKATKSKGARLPSSLLTMLFRPIKKYSIKGLLTVEPDRPVIIIAIKSFDEKYRGTLLSILREIYRMKRGGSPLGRYTGTKVTKYIVEDELIRQGFIKVVDDSRADFLKFFGIKNIKEFSEKVDLNKLRDRLIELSIQKQLSFLVFYIDESKGKHLLKYLNKLKDEIAPAKIIVISPRKLDPLLKRELARISWGFVEPSKRLINDTIDQHFKLREEEFNNILEKISTKRKYVKVVKESVEDEEGMEGLESTLHYQLKVFIVYYLMKNMKKLKISEKDIETEVELLVNGKKIIPDVYVKSRKIAIEVETFYGTGLTPWRKLERTIEKYLNLKSNVVDEVWIVLPPLQTMLYLKDLVSEIKELKEKGYNFIKLYTVDLLRRRLVSIEKISRRLSKLFTELASI